MKLLTVDVESPLPDIAPPTVGEQWVLVRLHGQPLGMLSFPRHGCRASELADLIATRFATRILCHRVADSFCAAGTRGATNLDALRAECPQHVAYDPPRVTVTVCTRNGADRLAECLNALDALDYPEDRLDLLVIDNAPSDDRTATLVRERYPRFRYVCEPRPGLDWARNCAILSARGDIVAYTDDDVSVDPGWVNALARVFVEEPEVDAVTGLIVPDEIDVEPQRLFEKYGGFGRGYDRRYFHVNAAAGERAATRHAGAGKFGAGANMAFRRSVFARSGMFDPALDVGTATNGGGDLEMFFRVLKTGSVLVYEPAAIVRHRHRRTSEQLHTQITNNGVGFYAYLVRTARAFRDERAEVVRLGVSWFFYWSVRRLIRSFIRPADFPRRLILAELFGSIAGLRRYAPARRGAARILATFGPQDAAVTGPK